MLRRCVFVVSFVTLSLSADARELYAMPMLLPLSLANLVVTAVAMWLMEGAQ